MRTARNQAIQIAREILSQNPVYLDTETTGIDRSSEIVEICILDDDAQILFQSLVKPTVSIPPDVIRIHGITNEMVKSAPSWLTVWPLVEATLTGRQVGIYNADFDLRMMQQTHTKFHIPWRFNRMVSSFCIMRLYAQFYGEWNPAYASYRWHSLEAAGRHCQIPLPNTHRAYDDALLARQVLHHIAKSGPD